jgi:hypothetical protein
MFSQIYIGQNFRVIFGFLCKWSFLTVHGKNGCYWK